MEFPLLINDDYFFSPPEEKDVPALVEYLNDKEIHDRTLMIPHPYTKDAAEWFISFCGQLRRQFGHDLNLAIRNRSGALVGVVGFHGKNTIPPQAHRDEIGYWIARPLWGKGIMSAAIPVLVEYGRSVRGISRFEAPVYSGNIASQKVLLKCGFREEGTMRKAYFKNGEFRDGKLFALVF